jgi:hypothetical protein
MQVIMFDARAISLAKNTSSVYTCYRSTRMVIRNSGMTAGELVLLDHIFYTHRTHQ